MGFFSTYGASRADIISEVTQPSENEDTGAKGHTIAHCSTGNTLWMVREIAYPDGRTERYIACYLLAKRPEGWGYRPMDESMGPCYYNCPLRYLELAPDPETGESTGWRQQVREWHAAQAAQKAKAKSLAIGQKWSLVGASGLTYVVIGRTRPTVSGQCDDGRFYRIPAKMLGELLDERAIPYAAQG